MSNQNNATLVVRRYKPRRGRPCALFAGPFPDDNITIEIVRVGKMDREDDDLTPTSSSSAKSTKTSAFDIKPIMLEDGSFKCPLEGCGKSFPIKSKWRGHVRVHKASIERKHSCHVCGATFGRKTDVTRHFLARHSVEKPFECETCGKCFGRRDARKKHQQTCQQTELQQPSSAESSNQGKTVGTPAGSDHGAITPLGSPST
ncbi:hypothetical protein HK102_002012, partial [Quaeritorhiza haematococci]